MTDSDTALDYWRLINNSLVYDLLDSRALVVNVVLVHRDFMALFPAARMLCCRNYWSE